ncbi:MAG: ABC-2 family transporter protein [Oscillospiraceae bacterium]|nr:ABC-2 family transporter protein [Oscillospiraceae bacterium]
MRAYAALLRIRIVNGLQYRAAALAGLATQFAWGFMEILAFSAFHAANPGAFPMEFQALVSYIWIQQAFLTLLMPWGGASEAVDSIVGGNIAYDLARPIGLYGRWFFETAGRRIAMAALRCGPVLAVAFLLPKPFGLALPSSPLRLAAFLASLTLGLLVVTSFAMVDNISTFYTMSRYNAVFVILADFLAGGYIPLPFFPEPIRTAVELTPFAAMQNMPLRIYGGDISGPDAVRGIALQAIWLAILTLAGKAMMGRALRRVVSQGG